MATATIYRTTSATADSGTTKIFTWSAWVKRAKSAVTQGLCMNKKSDSNTNQRWRLYFTATDTLIFENKDSGGTDDCYLATKQLFTDPGAWYHIVLVYDTTQTEVNRVKIYVNGLSVEDNGGWSVTNRASADFTTNWSSDWEHYIGKAVDDSGSDYFFDGTMSHVHCTYGTAYQASTFGEFDSTSGIWTIETSPSVTYGSQGYFLKMEDSSNLDLDSGTNTLTMSTTGTLSATKDCPHDNFAVINPLNRQSGTDGDIIHTNANTTIYDNGANWRSAYGTIGDNTGKYYFETKIVGASTNWWVGVCDAEQMNIADAKFVAETRGYGTNAAGDRGNSGSEVTWTGQIATAQNGIVMIAIDMVNGKIYFGSDGVWMASGDPTSGSTGTGAAYSITTGKFYLPAYALYSTTAGVSANFGNGVFGTTAVTSAGTNASNIGIFEYDVPTGYTAFSTKGLQE